MRYLRMLSNSVVVGIVASVYATLLFVLLNRALPLTFGATMPLAAGAIVDGTDTVVFPRPGRRPRHGPVRQDRSLQQALDAERTVTFIPTNDR